MLYRNTVIRFFILISALVLLNSNLYAHSNHSHSKKSENTLDTHNTHKDTRAIHVKHARVNPIFTGMPVTAAYFTLRNKSDNDLTLVAVSGSISERIEIHEHIMDNGLMKMQEVTDGIVLPAGGKTRFKPGGYHIMIMDLNQDIKEGDIVELTLEFDDHFVICPTIIFAGENIDFTNNSIGEKGKSVSSDFEYNSENNSDFLTVEQIVKLNKHTHIG